MDKCNVCGGTEFYTEAGFYFCQECQTQQEVNFFFYYFIIISSNN